MLLQFLHDAVTVVSLQSNHSVLRGSSSATALFELVGKLPKRLVLQRHTSDHRRQMSFAACGGASDTDDTIARRGGLELAVAAEAVRHGLVTRRAHGAMIRRIDQAGHRNLRAWHGDAPSVRGQERSTHVPLLAAANGQYTDMVLHRRVLQYSTQLPGVEDRGVQDTMKIQVRVGPSRIAGQGLFAAQEIKQGTRIVQYSGEKIASVERARRLAAGNAYIFHLNYRYAIDGATLANTARYINHSCDPNCIVETTDDSLWIVALRHIVTNEELSFNYGYDMQHYRDNPCHCGAYNCCGYILDPQYWGRI